VRDKERVTQWTDNSIFKMILESRTHTMTKALIDHRVYNIAPRCMPQFLEIFNRMGMPVLKATLGTPMGMYTTVVGPLNQFVHLWAYDNMAEYEARSLARDTHPDFPAYLAATKELVISQETMLMKTIPSLAHHLAE
jgi:hypothetical protein